MNTLMKLLVSLLVIGSAATMAASEINPGDFSGWMEDYDSLSYDEKRNAFLFHNEAERGNYKKIMVQSVVLYSKSASADSTVAVKASDYMKEGIITLLERKNLLATEPGPNVAAINLAITGVEKSKEDLKAYNFVPVAAVFRGAQAATGNVATYIEAMFEGEITDSVSGERLSAIVIRGIEETEKRSGDSLEFEDVKPTLDKWLGQLDQTLDKYTVSQD